VIERGTSNTIFLSSDGLKNGRMAFINIERPG